MQFISNSNSQLFLPRITRILKRLLPVSPNNFLSRNCARLNFCHGGICASFVQAGGSTPSLGLYALFNTLARGLIRLTPLNLAILVGLGASFWVVSEITAPQISQANTEQTTFYIQQQPNESYETLLSRAENVAFAIAQQRFDQDSPVSKVIVLVTAESNGLVVPILRLEVSRDQWKRRMQPQRWITYLTSSRSLLGFENSISTQVNPPSFENSIPVQVNPPSINSLPRNALPPEPPGSPL